MKKFLLIYLAVAGVFYALNWVKADYIPKWANALLWPWVAWQKGRYALSSP